MRTGDDDRRSRKGGITEVAFALFVLPNLVSNLSSTIFFDYETDWRQLETMSYIANGLTLSNWVFVGKKF